MRIGPVGIGVGVSVGIAVGVDVLLGIDKMLGVCVGQAVRVACGSGVAGAPPSIAGNAMMTVAVITGSLPLVSVAPL